MKFLITLVSIAFFTASAHALSEVKKLTPGTIVETVVGRMHFSLANCDANGGCVTNGEVANFPVELDLTADESSNNTDGKENRIYLNSDVAVAGHVFVNKVIRESRTYYIVSLTCYGYNKNGGVDPFPMMRSTVEFNDLKEFESTSLDTPEFKVNGELKRITFTINPLSVK